MQEKELQQNIVKYFSQKFNIYQEVWSTNKKKRIDLVMVHKSDLNNEYPFGIEIKKDVIKQGKDLAKWLKQASQYSELEFSTFGKLIVLVAPQITMKYLREGYDISNHERPDGMPHHNNVNTFIAQFGIGEIMKLNRFNFIKKKSEENYCFVFNSLILYEFHSDFLNIDAIKRLQSWNKQK